MSGRLRHWIGAGSLFALIGCGGGVVSGPRIPWPAWTTENPSVTRARGAPAETAAGGGPSSLDALQRGAPPSTPPSSPLQEIYFDFDSAALRADAVETLQNNARWLKDNPAARVEVEGHCDDRGTNEYNIALGARRARSARDYLARLGVAGERMTTISFGEEVPVCVEKTEDCRQRNRRVRFILVPARPGS
ncbi:MAG TPA: peptidoglycan-associated lipoprotein Pal [candidate division Zixibacteria bacterium]|nr:peptidoglycan-associated lipoprotein Pal [candidate division Zixibacteria bacterium]